jgi:flagellar biosynthesis component FlhA
LNVRVNGQRRIPGADLLRRSIYYVAEESLDDDTSSPRVLESLLRRIPGADLVRRALSSVTDESLNDDTSSPRVLESLLHVSPQQAVDAVRLACAEVVKRSPAALLTMESADRYRTGLLNGADDGSLFDSHRLRTILAPVLNLRISIADQQTVAQVLMEGIDQERSDAMIVEDLIVALQPDEVEVQMPRAYLKQITLGTSERQPSGFSEARDNLFYELGVRYPSFHFAATEDLAPDTLRFKINHLTTLPVRGLRSDECLVVGRTDLLELLSGIQGHPAIHPADATSCTIIQAEDADRARQLGLTTWNQMDHLIEVLSSTLRANAALFLDRDVVDSYLGELESSFPKLVAVARAHIPPPLMTQTLRLLLAEELSIRDLHQILQSMIDFHLDDSKYDIIDIDLIAHGVPDDKWMSDPVYLTSFVRTKRKRYITYKYGRGRNTLGVYLLEPGVEGLLANPLMMTTEAFLAGLDPHGRDQILAAVEAGIGGLPTTAQTPVVLTTSSVRPIFRELIAQEFPDVAVISYQELQPDIDVEPIARLG